MIEIGDLVNLYNGDLHCSKANGDILHQKMEQTAEDPLQSTNIVLSQSF